MNRRVKEQFERMENEDRTGITCAVNSVQLGDSACKEKTSHERMGKNTNSSDGEAFHGNRCEIHTHDESIIGTSLSSCADRLSQRDGNEKEDAKSKSLDRWNDQRSDLESSSQRLSDAINITDVCSTSTGENEKTNGGRGHLSTYKDNNSSNETLRSSSTSLSEGYKGQLEPKESIPLKERGNWKKRFSSSSAVLESAHHQEAGNCKDPPKREGSLRKRPGDSDLQTMNQEATVGSLLSSPSMIDLGSASRLDRARVSSFCRERIHKNAIQMDPLGLPYPINDALNRDNIVESGHAVVEAQAHFPPPSTTSSGSSDNGFISKTSKPAPDGGKRRTSAMTSCKLDPPKKSNGQTSHSSLKSHQQGTKGTNYSKNFKDKNAEGCNLHDEKIDQITILKKPQSIPSSTQTLNIRRAVEDGSSASGSDGGYAASASSNDNGANSCSSTSSDDEDGRNKSPGGEKIQANSGCAMKRSQESSSSSDIADFSSGSADLHEHIRSQLTSNLESDSCSRWLMSLKQPQSVSSEGGHTAVDDTNSPKENDLKQRADKINGNELGHEISHPSSELEVCKQMARNMAQPKGFATLTQTDSVSREFQCKRAYSSADGNGTSQLKRKKLNDHKVHRMNDLPYVLQTNKAPTQESKKADTEQILGRNTTTIYDIGVDIMANILTHLEPTEIYTILSTPISKTWRATFATPDDLWKVLCLSGPFYAKLDFAKGESSDDSARPICKNTDIRHIFGCHRLLYSSFHRCIRYLEKIKEDSTRGHLANDNALDTDAHHIFSGNSSLKDFFARARNFTTAGERGGAVSDTENSQGSSSSTSKSDASNGYISAREGPERKKRKKGKSKIKFSQSSLTKKLLGPVPGSLVAGHFTSLPYSCAIYSIVNYMITFIDVVGIQIMCLKVLPHLLEDEKQRTAAQHAGLTDTVLRAMVLFPDDIDLHTYAFHTLVLLARPLGKKEGMLLFRRTLLNESRIFKAESRTSMSGIAVMLDSMRRFASSASLQAMSCWSMVNIALIPSQKVVLVKLGGIAVAANAMFQHPHNPEVQFRALFALINLVIPSENLPENSSEADVIRQQVGEVNDRSEREMLEESLDQVVNLVVVAMRNFCASEAILNRACLILHNLSLNASYHMTLLRTPNCFQMLRWCLENYRSDNVLQKSAGGTLQRLEHTLSNNDELRAEFLAMHTRDRRSRAENSEEETN